ncbi:hypothetical protein CHS0354_022215 [Potamilus streckersoni]|uniref:Transmembrane protein n=1 Tax=Potamilus streckersoni TaxID=2493646 RepID=A0AAE0W539_9BIVA|nr:hypothetical protein CHS0354_022215 [Potamilus streckersoni]
MGHVHSKRKKERRKRKDVEGTISSKTDKKHGKHPHQVAAPDSCTMASTEKVSDSSGYHSGEFLLPSVKGKLKDFLSVSNAEKNHNKIDDKVSCNFSDNTEIPVKSSTKYTTQGKNNNKIDDEVSCHFSDHTVIPVKSSTKNTTQEMYSYKSINVDDHPALTKLQNEQNTRLEDMEQRMAKIRTNALQSLERKKFAYLFRAKKDEGQTEKLLQEAREMLARDKLAKAQMINNNNNKGDYKGEIIPVSIVSEPQTKEQKDGYLQMLPFQSLKLSDPFVLLMLPLLLPLFIIVAFIKAFVGASDLKKTVQSKKKSKTE